MGRRYAPSSLFYDELVRTDVRGLEQKMFHVKHFLLNFFAFVGGFCIGSSNSGVDNTKKMPILCSTNIATGILLCPVRFFGGGCRREDVFYCYRKPLENKLPLYCFSQYHPQNSMNEPFDKGRSFYFGWNML